jgi:predicted metal-dependent phosphotriesterase family hydrolase
VTRHARTVLGDVAGEALGRVDYHEHAFQVTPVLAGDELDDEHRSASEFASLKSSGFSSYVDAIPFGPGRQPPALRRLSEKTGIHVVATTGAHKQEHYRSGDPVFLEPEEGLVRRFVADVLDGMPESDAGALGPAAQGVPGAGETRVRAGMLKAGVGYWRISSFEQKILSAVAAAHRTTGAPVMVHLDAGTAAFEVIQVLRDQDVRLDHVVLAHVDRNPDPRLHADLAAAGVYIGYDGFGRAKDWPDSMLIDCLLRAAELGAQNRIMLGTDLARASRYIAYGGLPGLSYLGTRVLPRLVGAAGQRAVDDWTVENPGRLLSVF